MNYDEKKYRPGLGRSVPEPRRAHLYTMGDHCMDFQLPMCSYGWNRDGGESYSIWRGNVGPDGICKICLRRASKGLAGVESKFQDEGEYSDWCEGASPEEISQIEEIIE